MEEIFVLAFLGINNWKDIRKKEISVPAIGLFAIWGIARAFLNENICLEWLGALSLGILLIALSIISKGEIGMGDGMVLSALGTVLTFSQLLSVLMLGLLCCGISGFFLLAMGKISKKTEIPFVPFLLLGYIGGLVC